MFDGGEGRRVEGGADEEHGALAIAAECAFDGEGADYLADRWMEYIVEYLNAIGTTATATGSLVTR